MKQSTIDREVTKRFTEWGRQGGQIGGRKRAKSLSPERLREIASMGGKASKAKREAAKA